MTVVQDDSEALVAWLQVGTPVYRKLRADGREQRADKTTLFTAETVQIRDVWRDWHNLRIYQPGMRWSTWLFFHGESGAFEGWYCNIEDPHRREGFTTISRDHVLDVEVEPDRSVARKDEDELVLAVEQGRYTPAEADAITAVADEIEAVVAAWDSPFCDGWESFRPDPTWPIPPLPSLP